MERWPAKVKQKSDFERTRKQMKCQILSELIQTVLGRIGPEIFFSTSDEHQALLMEMLPARVPLAQNMVQMSSATAWFWIMWWRHASVKMWTRQSNYHNSVLFSHKWALDRIEFGAKLCKCVSHSGTSLLLLEQFNTSNSKIKCNVPNGCSFA